MSSSQPVPSTAAAPQQSLPLDLIPVLLKEAALDSPTFRAAVCHFVENLDSLAQGLEIFVKTASHLASHASSLEKSVQEFLHAGTTLSAGSEGGAVWDPDYAPWAIKKWGENTREYWTAGVLPRLRAQETGVAEPIRGFLANDLKAFREVRRALDASQKTYDATLARYAAQSKSKEPSALREEAFQVYETRKAYWKCGFDFAVVAPAVRVAVDRVVVKVFCGEGGEKVKAWARGLEESERVFRKEVALARKRIEEAAWSRGLPSRGLEEYAASTVPFLGGSATAAAVGEKGGGGEGAEGTMQGWLFLKTIAGKAPPRTVWSRRWFYVRGGVFGWLLPGARGGVEESEKVGVLLCSVRPAFQEERRFCFDVKTKDSGMVLQAETQAELMEWIATFEMAKRQALEGTTTGSLAFAVTPPVAPEFAAKVGEQHAEEAAVAAAAAASAADGAGGLSLAARPSFDVTTTPAAKRVVSLAGEKSGESSSDGGGGGAARIMQRLELHKRGNALQSASPYPGTSGGGGGIASLISASHSSMPIGPGALPPPLPTASAMGAETVKRTFTMSSISMMMATTSTSTLAPNTLANPPAPTHLSLAAVAVGGGSPGAGVLANLWGSCEWGVVNRLGDQEEETKEKETTLNTTIAEGRAAASTTDQSVGSGTPAVPVSRDDNEVMDGHGGGNMVMGTDIMALSTQNLAGHRHRKTLSAATPDTATPLSGTPAQATDEDAFPASYPAALQTQQAQFRLLFPTAPRGSAHHLVLVFRATWNPHDGLEFPGRVYVTPYEMYFYAHHLGLVFTTAVRLRSITDVTGAPGREGDMIFLHLGEGKGRVTVKVFLEGLGLLLRRLRLLIRNARSERPDGVEELVKSLTRLEAEDEDEDMSGDDRPRGMGSVRNVAARLRVDGSLSARTGRELASGGVGGQKFRLPAQPVVYVPKGMRAASLNREVPVSAKALFHILFGDKSVLFRPLYGAPTAWAKEAGNWTRRFVSHGSVQTIDVLNEHLCYVVTHSHPPSTSESNGRGMVVLTKYVLTHAAKSRCMLAVYQHLSWSPSVNAPRWGYIRRLIERDVMRSLDADACVLADLATEQVGRLEGGSKTMRAVEIFGSIGTLGSTNLAVVPALEETRHVAVPRRRVARLVADDLVAHIVAALGWVADVGLALVKRLWAIWSAHAMLVVLLGLSAVWNVWFGYRDGLSWWRERDAVKFLARMGVGSTGTGKGERRVFLGTGVEDLLGASAPSEGIWWEGNETNGIELGKKTCRTAFAEQVVLTTSTSMPKEYGEGFRRLRRTREALARYRHDLLVAMRVVDRVERTVVEEEWEEWVRTEGRNCARLESMLREVRSRDDDVVEEELGRELGEEIWAYCRSCREEAGLMG